MGGRKKKKTVDLKEKGVIPLTTNGSITARNLRKSDLRGFIFCCKHHTIKDCHSKLLFGLPSHHLAYVEKIRPGLPLFLFNCSNRKLHGIYEATSSGKSNMDPRAWIDDSGHTPYPAQVRIKVLRRCSPLSEDEFKPIIAGNYYELRLFWLELDQAQTDGLISLFTSSTRPLNMPLRQNSNMGQPSSRAFTFLDCVDVAWRGSYAAIVSGKDGSIPEQKPICNSERKWSSLFDDGASSSKAPLQTGEKKLLKAIDNSEWPNVEPDLKKNQSIEAHNSMWDPENYYTESQLEADFDASSECSYHTAVEDVSSTDVQSLLTKLMEEVEALKVSHDVMQREQVHSKATILLLKIQYDTLIKKASFD